MPEAQSQTNVFDLRGGLNTELNEVQWPDGFTRDESNYELMSDGTRRRRRGLAKEATALYNVIDKAIDDNMFCQTYKWRNAGGDPNKNMIVHQIGQYLYFQDDIDDPSTSWYGQTFDIGAYAAEVTPTAANLNNYPVTFSQGRGHLFVSGPYIQPFYVEWDGTDFAVRSIQIQYRDFEGIDDGVNLTTEPTGATPTADHRYNLRNRGWSDTLLNDIEASLGAYPAKNGIWHYAYDRVADESTASAVEKIGTLTYNAGKYDAETFGNSSAPQGSLFLDPFDTTYAGTLTGGGTKDISDWDVVGGEVTDPWVIRITATGHGYAGPFPNTYTVTVQDNLSYYWYGDAGIPLDRDWDFNGTHTMTFIDANTLEFTVAKPTEFDSWLDQYTLYGYIGDPGYEALAKSDGAVVETGFKAIAFHAGRIFYAGNENSAYADHVFFSRIAESPQGYGECHQRQDPTSPDFNEITPADGGVIVIPGMSGIKDMMTVGNSLLLFGSEGVWEIMGNRGGAFTATAYQVRKITSANFNSVPGSLNFEDGAVAVGPSGIYMFAPNQYTGMLEAQNVIENTIQTHWSGFSDTQMSRCQVAWDDAKRRLYFSIPHATKLNSIIETLVFNTKTGSWYRLNFNPTGTYKYLTTFTISDADKSTDNQKVKYLYMEGNTLHVNVADFDQTDYVDIDGNESPLPYMVTGYNLLGDPQRRGQAPIVSVLSRRTETGFTADLQDAVNESSTLMTAFWDWTDDTEWDNPAAPTTQRGWTGTAGNYGVSGKIGARAEVYRHQRSFIPVAQTDVDGFPVVVTRNKVRGRGRVLSLRFDGATGKDSHLIGWTLNTKTSRRL